MITNDGLLKSTKDFCVLLPGAAYGTKLVHGCMVLVSFGTKHVTTKQRCNHYGGYSKYTVTHSESHTTRVQTTAL